MENSQESDISVGLLSQSTLDSQNASQDDDAMPDDPIWGTDFTGLTSVAFDDSASGPNHPLGLTAGPLDFFSLFWDADIVSLIVTETNR